MQALSLQEKSLRLRLIHTLQWVLQLAAGGAIIASLLVGSLLWQPYADQSEMERELANETYLRVVAELQSATCVYHHEDWLPFLACESAGHKRFTLRYEVLVYEGNSFYYSPFYAAHTDKIVREFKNKPIPDEVTGL
ncbi:MULTISPECIES: hypothetical protein [unclassified Spirosoma]|uniref:hypothetical protein n=1 Tax=unclassified Spirosoma TaxID=2621999 RepID=UPI00095E3645|nr:MULTISPECIES: hypothetical protein [unclassified Spirosoma]MBN8821586.1 hypothetical protein [Spirosoma sp.]OJW78357.1 MAG: hypothetical protein BGO59_30595 [Spirosoma sp. 48-14]